MDGGNDRVPTFGFYETDGTWGVEGHGIDPTMVAIDDPAKMKDGGDPQLEEAVEVLLEGNRNQGLQARCEAKVPRPQRHGTSRARDAAP
jgi:C-terminal processing protease CtpA/Prc